MLSKASVVSEHRTSIYPDSPLRAPLRSERQTSFNPAAWQRESRRAPAPLLPLAPNRLWTPSLLQGEPSGASWPTSSEQGLACGLRLNARRSPWRRSAPDEESVKAVEDHVEAEEELAVVVVAGPGDVATDDLDQVRVVGQGVRVGDHLSLGFGREVLGRLGGHVGLLEGEAVDVGVLHRHGMDGHLDREAGRA